MNSQYMPDVKLFEDFFDSEEVSATVSDDGVQGENGSLDTDSTSYIPKYQLCWFPPHGLTLYPLAPTTVRQLHSLMDSMRYIRNLRLAVTGRGLENPQLPSYKSTENTERDFFECSEECPPVASGSPQAAVVQLKFDYNESRSDSPSYMVNVLLDVMIFFIKFSIILKMPIEYQTKHLFVTYMPDDLTASMSIQKALYHRLNIHNDYRKLKMMNMTFDELGHVLKLLDAIGSSLTVSDLVKYQGTVNPRSATLMKSLLNQNVSKNLLQKLDIDETTKKKTKTLIVRVPENKELKLKNLSLSILKEDMKKEKVELVVDGTLVINSFDEFANLQFLKRGYEHNKLVIQTLLSPKMLRYLLVSVYLKELDLSHADFTEEVSVDLSFKYVMNHDIKISSNSQLEIKNSIE